MSQQDEIPTIPIIKREGQVSHPTAFAAVGKLAILKIEGLLEPMRKAMQFADDKREQPTEVMAMSRHSQETIDKIMRGEPIEEIDAMALSFVLTTIAGTMLTFAQS